MADPGDAAASSDSAAAGAASGPSGGGSGASQDEVRLQVGQFLKAKQVETVREKKFSAEMTVLRQRMEVLESDVLQYMAMKGQDVLDTGRVEEVVNAKGETDEKYIQVKLAFKATAKQWTPSVSATMNQLLFGSGGEGTGPSEDDAATESNSSAAVEEAAALGFEGLNETEARVVCAYQWYMSLLEDSEGGEGGKKKKKKKGGRGRSIVVGPPTRANLLFAVFDSIRRGDLASKATHLADASKRATKAEKKRRAKEEAARREQAIKAAAAQGTTSGGGDDDPDDEAAVAIKAKAYEWVMDGRRLKALRAISKGKKKKTARLLEKQKAFIMRHLDEKGADRIPVNVRMADSQKKAPYNIQVVTHTKKKSVPAKVATQIFRDRLGTVFESVPARGDDGVSAGAGSAADVLDEEVESAGDLLTWFRAHRDLVATVGTTFNEDLVQWQADHATVVRDVDLRPQNSKKAGKTAGKKSGDSASDRERAARKRAAEAEERQAKRKRRQAFIEDLPEDMDPATVGADFF